MSPLFPDSLKSNKSTDNVPIQEDKRFTIELAEKRLRIIDEFGRNKNKSTICSKISSSFNSHLKFKEPSQEMIEERRQKCERELGRRALYTRLSWKKER